MSDAEQFKQYDDLKLVRLVEILGELQRAKEELEDRVKGYNAHIDFLRITKIPTVMEDEGIERISVAGVGRVSLTADMHVSIKADAKPAFYDWLRDNGRTDLISETVNPSTLKAAVKKMIRDGEETPHHLLNISPFVRASITKE